MTRGRRERLAYWRSVPLRDLGFLAGAAFCLFASLGLLLNLPAAGQAPMFASYVWAVYSGLVATGYLLAIGRRPVVLPLVIAGQIVSNLLLNRLMEYIAKEWHAPPAPAATVAKVTAIGATALCLAAYSLFLIFIQKQGRAAVRVQTELALAHGIQQTLVPAVNVRAAGCSVYGISAPSDKVGGDLVDCVPLSDGSVMAYLIDVAGHGLQAGILMGMVKTAVRTQLVDQASPAELFTRLNAVLPQVKEAHMYATCAALRIYPKGTDGRTRVDYALAGHPAILHIARNRMGAEPLSSEQFPVGLFARATYEGATAMACDGDLFVAVSDGILEAARGEGAEFGCERLGQLMSDNRGEALAALGDRTLRDVRKYGNQTDDQTLLLVRIG